MGSSSPECLPLFWPVGHWSLGPPTSTPSSGLVPCAGFSQPAKQGAPSSSPIPAGVSLGFEEFPVILMPPSPSSCLLLHRHASTLGPGAGGLEHGLPSSGHVPDTWHLPAASACPLWPGPADGALRNVARAGKFPAATLHSVPACLPAVPSMGLGSLSRHQDPGPQPERAEGPGPVSQLSGPLQKHPSSPAIPPYPASWNSSSWPSGALG